MVFPLLMPASLAVWNCRVLWLSLSLSLAQASVRTPLWSPAKSGAVICTPALRFTLSHHSPPLVFCTWRLGNPLHFHHCCKQFDTGFIAQVHLPQSTKWAAFLTGPCCHGFICNNFTFVTRGPDPGSSLAQMASWDVRIAHSLAHVCTLVQSLAHTPQDHLSNHRNSNGPCSLYSQPYNPGWLKCAIRKNIQ